MAQKLAYLSTSFKNYDEKSILEALKSEDFDEQRAFKLLLKIKKHKLALYDQEVRLSLENNNLLHLGEAQVVTNKDHEEEPIEEEKTSVDVSAADDLKKDRQSENEEQNIEDKH